MKLEHGKFYLIYDKNASKIGKHAALQQIHLVLQISKIESNIYELQICDNLHITVGNSDEDFFEEESDDAKINKNGSLFDENLTKENKLGSINLRQYPHHMSLIQ